MLDEPSSAIPASTTLPSGSESRYSASRFASSAELNVSKFLVSTSPVSGRITSRLYPLNFDSKFSKSASILTKLPSSKPADSTRYVDSFSATGCQSLPLAGLRMRTFLSSKLSNEKTVGESPAPEDRNFNLLCDTACTRG